MSERKGTKGLELWCRRMTAGYPGVNVVNMTTSWRDGLAFCAIIHHFRPDLIEFSKLNKDDIYYNNDLAFRTAERHLGVPALLEPEDMVEYPVPDRLSILTYLSQFYQTFVVSQGKSPSRIAPKRPASSPDHGIVSPASTSPPTKVSSPVAGKIRREPCAKCTHPVFLAERLNVGKLLYHRTCFKCARCKSQLTLANYYETESGDFCCETCPDEEKTITKSDDDNKSVLSRSLSDEEKSASLKKDSDEYSAKFETALEFPDDDSLKQTATLTPFAQARSFFMSTQVGTASNTAATITNSSSSSDDDDDDKPPDLPSTAPPSIVENQPEKDTTVNSILDDKDDNSLVGASSELKESLVVTKDTKSDYDVSVVKARMKLFEIAQNKSEDDDELTNEATTSSKVPDSEDLINTSDINFGSDDSKAGDENEIKIEDSSVITISDNDSVVEISDDSQLVKEEPPGNEYPDDLNPFDEGESLNPFDEDDDDDDDDEVPKPAARKKLKAASAEISSIYVKRISINPFEEENEERPRPATRKKVEAPRISLNPFWSEGDDAEDNSPIPQPKPRISKTTPEAKPREFRLSTSFGSSSSLASSNSHTLRKKKPAPRPPLSVGDLNESGHSSIASSPSQSVTHSPKSTPKIRKNKKAPPPPTSTPLNPHNQPAVALSLDDDYEKDKIVKDEANMTIRQNQQLHSPSSSENTSSLSAPNKSTYGKWKRRKGQAPTRPIPQKRTIESLPLMEVKRELEIIEIQQQGLERQGVRLEEIIRDKCEGPDANHEDESLPPEVEDLVLQLFELVNEKNELFRKQAELMYLRRQHRLEEEHADVEYQIRCLMIQPEPNKTDSDKAKEEELISRLVDIVERRNEIIECLEMDRVREAEEDDSISNQLTLYTAKKEAEHNKPADSKDGKKEKSKKMKKLKLKLKGHHRSKVDADKDVDESESSTSSTTVKVKEKQKKKKFNIF